MSNTIDKKAIAELYAMARVYHEHGHKEKADELVTLAKLMERRIASESRLVDINAYRYEERQLDA
jgi:hypothetical protein